MRKNQCSTAIKLIIWQMVLWDAVKKWTKRYCLRMPSTYQWKNTVWNLRFCGFFGTSSRCGVCGICDSNEERIYKKTKEQLLLRPAGCAYSKTFDAKMHFMQLDLNVWKFWQAKLICSFGGGTVGMCFTFVCFMGARRGWGLWVR